MSERSDLRAAAMERAGGRCEHPNCTYTNQKLDAAHLKGSGAGGSKYRDNLDNLIILCRPHHDWLDCRDTPNMRRFENEMILRFAIGRTWLDRR